MDRAREKFERWFCEKHKLTQFPKPEHRTYVQPALPTYLETIAEESWIIWKSGWDAK